MQNLRPRNMVSQLVMIIVLFSSIFTTACAMEDQSTNDPIATKQSDTGNPNISTVSQSVTGVWTYRVSIMAKLSQILSWMPNQYGSQHSALVVQFWKPDGSYGWYATCNHGTCGNDPTMTFMCSNTFQKSYELPQVNPYICDAYGPWAAAMSNAHVCNDDTKAEYEQLVYGHFDSSICTSGFWPTWFSPNCD